MADTTSTATARSGLGLFGWLTIIFVVLKLDPGGHLTSPVVDWSWWLVFSPILIGLGITLLILFGVGVAFLVAHLLDIHNARKRRKAARERLNRNR